jgi:hypothetical protein
MSRSTQGIHRLVSEIESPYPV